MRRQELELRGLVLDTPAQGLRSGTILVHRVRAGNLPNLRNKKTVANSSSQNSFAGPLRFGVCVSNRRAARCGTVLAPQFDGVICYPITNKGTLVRYENSGDLGKIRAIIFEINVDEKSIVSDHIWSSVCKSFTVPA